jgi:hypothetical protein
MNQCENHEKLENKIDEILDILKGDLQHAGLYVRVANLESFKSKISGLIWKIATACCISVITGVSIAKLLIP